MTINTAVVGKTGSAISTFVKGLMYEGMNDSGELDKHTLVIDTDGRLEGVSFMPGMSCFSSSELEHLAYIAKSLPVGVTYLSGDLAGGESTYDSLRSFIQDSKFDRVILINEDQKHWASLDFLFSFAAHDTYAVVASRQHVDATFDRIIPLDFEQVVST